MGPSKLLGRRSAGQMNPLTCGVSAGRGRGIGGQGPPLAKGSRRGRRKVTDRDTYLSKTAQRGQEENPTLTLHPLRALSKPQTCWQAAHHPVPPASQLRQDRAVRYLHIVGLFSVQLVLDKMGKSPAVGYLACLRERWGRGWVPLLPPTGLGSWGCSHCRQDRPASVGTSPGRDLGPQDWIAVSLWAAAAPSFSLPDL